MPKDYKYKQAKKAEDNTNSMMPFVSGLAVGLIITAVVFVQTRTHESEIKPVNEDETITLEPKEEKVSLSDLVEQENLEEPTYEFYKILPDLEVNVSEWDETETPILPQTEQSQTPGVYVLQVGSFRKLEAADEVKAKLALMGINADIQRVVINGQDVFHRVRIGPYNTSKKLEEAQSRLMANELDFKLLKLTVEQE